MICDLPNQKETLEKLFSNDSSYFETVIVEPIVHQALKINSKDARNYFSRHLPRLLKVAFRDDNEFSTISAFKLLKIGNIPNLTKSSFFSGFAVKLLSQDQVSDQIIGRLSEITLNILTSCNSEILRYSGFVLLFFKYIDNQDVISMFTSLLKMDEKNKQVQDWLFEIGFDDELHGELEKALSYQYEEQYTKEYEKLISLIKIVTEALRNQRIRDRILSSQIPYLFRSSKEFPSLINNYLWEMLNEMLDQTTSENLSQYADAAYVILTRNDNHIYSYHNYALKFFSKYIKIDSRPLNEEFIQLLFGMMIKFDSCSHFLQEAKKFIVQGCMENRFSANMVKLILLILLNEAEQKKRSALRVISFAAIEELLANDSIKKVFLKFDGASHFIKTQLNPYTNIKQNEYGYPKDRKNKNKK